MGRCIEVAGIRQTQPERCMLTCMQSRTHCIALGRSVRTEPLVPLPRPAPLAAKRAAPATAQLPDSNGEPAPTFSWGRPTASTQSLFKFAPMPASSAPDVPLH
jgi:hypothetical protein